ncbi:Xaa-Pro dipeptidyl-peptidase [Evansella clarkii]|uniref:Xaa-Pro dipeptidyl-peptidase n=1 Tax=Evansella clarkii TaxID=79879 RepID=UPI001F30C8D5|nr:Xaa-Pro dipeptidyl-peptidase [Evansella clarkii]
MQKTKKKLILVTLIFTMLFSAPFTGGFAVLADDTGTVPAHVVEDGVTQEAFSYEDAVRESVFVETTLDTDGDGVNDRIAVDIIRPAETEEGLEVPVIMVPSPYYERLGRGNESQLKEFEDGVPVKFPLYYDNYFVPRGYAVALVDMIGTNNSDGCPTTGGYEETEGVKAVVDWLNGRADAVDRDDNEAEAYWSTGKVGMYGKSYDGTLANAVAATGVDGLETIVPIVAISSWYNYYRQNGVTLRNNGASGLANTVVASERRQLCAPVRSEIFDLMDDPSGNYNEFWDERNYVKDVDNVKASVFLVHGLNDLNVQTNHFGEWWEGLERNDVPRKIWLTQTAHTEPFDFRREEWVDTIHRWFDYWLLDIDNGIMDEPMADVERAANEWETYETWPAEDAKDVNLRFGPGTEDGAPGVLTSGPVQGNNVDTLVNDWSLTETQLVTNPEEPSENRLVFLSDVLTEELRISGTPELDVRATINGEAANLTAYLVDYGTDERVNHQGGSSGLRQLSERDCWGQSTERDSACYLKHEILTHTRDYEIVTRGFMDAQNYKNFRESNPLRDHKHYRFQWDAYTHDYVFKEGHRIGVVLASSTRSRTVPNREEVEVEIRLGQSGITLPVSGGKKAVDF